MNRFGSKPAGDFPSMTGYLLGAGAIVWLVTGWWTPLVVSGIGLAVLRKALRGLE
jgi:hypothetical protein